MNREIPVFRDGNDYPVRPGVTDQAVDISAGLRCCGPSVKNSGGNVPVPVQGNPNPKPGQTTASPVVSLPFFKTVGNVVKQALPRQGK